MFHTKNSKENVLHRLKIARGHLDKIIEMVEKDAYCIDVLTQTKAVQKALANADAVLLKNHLSHCIVDHIQNGRADQAIDEMMKIYQKS